MRERPCVLILLLAVTAPWSAVHGSPAKRRSASATTTKYDLLMPGVQPQIVDTYLCHSVKVGDDPKYLIGFHTLASSALAHHVLIYGCTEPGSEKDVWDCGEMHAKSNAYETAPVCSTGSNIVYAWAMDAPELHLPPGVGFKVGGDSDIQYLVLQVHYKDVSPFVPPNNKTDHSGVELTETDVPQPKRAGVYLMGTDGEIPPHATTYMETACSYNEPFAMHPFAFRTHAHSHGRVNAGYRVRDGNWVEIGRMSPQKPQMFYNVTNPGLTVKNGDILAARCTMVNDEDRTIKVGSTGNDEMCNFYIMYYVDGDRMPENNYCFSPGPPSWTWDDFAGLESDLAPPSASMVPGTKDLLAETNRFVNRVHENLDRQDSEMDDFVGNLLESLAEARGNYGQPDERYYEQFPRELYSDDLYADEGPEGYP